MNRTRALQIDTAGEQSASGLPMGSSGLRLSKSSLSFDRTDVGSESFLTLKVTPPKANMLVTVSVQDPYLFQVAIGVNRLTFKQVLTFTPDIKGTYIHLRYTPEQAGRHQSVLTIEAPSTAESLRISMTGHTGGIAGIQLPYVGRPSIGMPITRGSSSVLLIGLLIGSLLLGIGYACYVYRCRIWPGLCAVSIPVAESMPSREATLNPVLNRQLI